MLRPYARTFVHAYITFLLEVITWTPFTLESWNWICLLQHLSLQLYVRFVPRSCPGVWTRGQNVHKYLQMFKFTFKFTLAFTSAFHKNLGTFYARKLKFALLVTQAKTFNSVLQLPLRHGLGWGKGSITGQTWAPFMLEVEIWYAT